MVSIYQYLDYRKFLLDYYEEKKRTTKTMSYRNFARAAGLAGWNYLKLVVDGKRNLSASSIAKFAKALKLKKRETDFFSILVSMNQSSDPEEKSRYYEKLMTFRRFNEIHRMENDIYQLLSRWYIAAVHELVALPDFDTDPRWIAQQLRPNITIAEAKKALEILQHLGLIKIDREKNMTVQTKGHFATPDQVSGIAIFNFQKEMLALAHNALRYRSSRIRDISGLTIALSPEGFDTAKDMIREFRRGLHAKLATGGQPTAVYQLNFQIFPLSEVKATRAAPSE